MLNTHVSAEWLKWIKDNLANGCTADSLAQVMMEKGYAPLTAAQAILEIQKGHQPIYNKSISTNGYTYEKPRIAMGVNYIDTSDKRVYIGMRLDQPVVMTLDNLLSHDEVDQLIDLCRNKLAESKVVDPLTGQDAKIVDRKSEGTFFQRNESEFIAKLDKRISEVMNWPVENGEGIQVLHYHPGGEYKAHFDYFSYDEAGSRIHLAKGGNRVSTLIMYLSGVEQGGETTLPDVGLTIVPKKGSALYFEYCNSKGECDPLTLHAGMPVIKGEKWIATKWMRQGQYK